MTQYIPAGTVYFSSSNNRVFVGEVSPSENRFFMQKIISVLGMGTFTYLVNVNDILEMVKFPNITEKVKILTTGAEPNLFISEVL